MSELKDFRIVQRDELLKQENQKLTYRQLGLKLDSLLSHMARENPSDRLFTSDVPISDRKEDAFSFRGLSDEVVEQIFDSQLQTPLAFCIDGYWGSGKSSFAKLIYDSLQGDLAFGKGCLPVWIDTSLITGSEDVLRVVAEKTLKQGRQAARRILGLPDEFGLVPLSSQPITFSPSPGLEGSTDKKLISRLEDYAESWLEFWSDSPSQKWDYEKIKELIREIRHALLGGGGVSKIVYFIDDLDRCEDEVIIKILELHRLLLEEWGIVLIYAMDYKIIASVIGKYFLAQGGVYNPHIQEDQWNTPLKQGEKFLEKFFSTRIRPPEPTEINLKKWLIEQLGDDCYFEGLDEFVCLAFLNNPRYIKRFTNSIRFLKNRFHIAKLKANVMDWQGLVDLSRQDDNHALQIMTKVAAFALAQRNLSLFYETVRYPSVMRLLELELEAQVHGAFQITLDAGRAIRVPIPEELRILFSKGPRFEDTPPLALESAILVIEPILATPRMWSRRLSPDTQFLTVEQSDSKDAQAITKDMFRPSFSEKENAGNIVLEWLSDLQHRWDIPEEVGVELRRTLIRTAPDSAVEVFRNTDKYPKVVDLAVASENTMLQARLNDAYWLFCASCVHPDWSAQNMYRAAQFLESISFSTAYANARVSTLLNLLFEVSTTLHPDDKTLSSEFARILVHSDEEKKIKLGLERALKLLQLDLDSLDKNDVRMDDKFDEDYFSSSFFWAADALELLGRFPASLHLCEAAIRTPGARKLSGIIRSLARAQHSNNDSGKAQRLYYAAIAMRIEETQACDWVIPVMENENEKIRCYMTMVARQPSRQHNWNAVGVHIHNHGIREQATDWFKNALALEPESKSTRKNLYNHLWVTYNYKGASAVIEEGYIPDFNQKLLKQVEEAHEDFIRTILLAGKVEYKVRDDTIVLFDPDDPPAWIEEKFGKWSPRESRFIQTKEV